MARQSILDLILNWKQRGATEPKKAKENIKELGKGSKELKGITDALSLSSVAVGGALLGVGVAALRQIPVLLELGNQYERANVALTAYAGGAGEAILATRAVEEAAGGAVDKLTATQNATRLFSMGLASNSEEAGKLSEAAVKLSAAVGKDAKTGFEEFALLLANQSIPRLDTFGLSAGKVRRRIRELQDANADMTRETAFMTAVMEEAEIKVAALDAAGFQAVSSSQKLATAWENTKLTIATATADALEPAIDKINEGADAFKAQEREILKGANSWEEYEKGVKEAFIEQKEFSGLWKLQIGIMDALGMSTEDLGKANGVLAEEQVNAVLATRELTEANIELDDTYSELALSEADVKTQLAELSLLMKTDLSGALEDTQEKMAAQLETADSYRHKIGELTEDIALWRGEIQQIKDQEGPLEEEDIAKIDAYNERISDAQFRQGEYNDKITDTHTKVKELEEAWDQQTKLMIFGIAQQQLAIDGFTQEELDALAKLAGPEGFGLVDEAGQNLIMTIGRASEEMVASGDQSGIFVGQMNELQGAVSGANQDVAGLNQSINNLPANKTVTLTTVRRTFNETINTFRSNTVQTAFGASPGFAHGGEITLGGVGGRDQNQVTINAQPRERITVTPDGGVSPGERGGRRGAGGGRPVIVNNYNKFDQNQMTRVLRDL